MALPRQPLVPGGCRCSPGQCGGAGATGSLARLGTALGSSPASRGPVGLVLLGCRRAVAAGGGAGPAGSPPSLADVPLAEVGDRRGQGGGAAAGRLGGRLGLGGQRAVGGSRRRVALGTRRRGGRRGLAVDLHVLPQGAGVRVGLVAAADLAVVGLVRGVDVGMLLAVAAVGELPLAAVELALEGLLPCGDTATAPLPAGGGPAVPAALPPHRSPSAARPAGASGEGKPSPSLLPLPFPFFSSPFATVVTRPRFATFSPCFAACHTSLAALRAGVPGWRRQGPPGLVCPLRRSPRTRETFITALMTEPKQNLSMPLPARAGVCRQPGSPGTSPA